MDLGAVGDASICEELTLLPFAHQCLTHYDIIMKFVVFRLSHSCSTLNFRVLQGLHAQISLEP